MEKTLIRNLSILVILATLFLSGCASVQQKGTIVPGAEITTEKTFWVEKLGPDQRGIEKMIASNLQRRGFTASSGDAGNMPEDVDILVTYQDKWMWDMTNYMIRLNIQFKDGSSYSLLASGESFRTSLARKSPEGMVDEVLDEIFKKIDPKYVTEEEK